VLYQRQAEMIAKLQAELKRVKAECQAQAKPAAPATLARLWKQENEKCRGGAGDDPRTDAACAARQTYDAKLRALGWCYEYQGAATVDWHFCSTP